MLMSRHKRLKTEYSKKSAQNRSFIHDASQHFKSLDRGTSVLSNERQSFITRIMREITKKVNYQQLDLNQIEQEGQTLRSKVKQMNRLLGKIIEKSIQKRNQDQRVAKKAVILREMGLNYNQLCKQFVQNTNKIRSLEEQFYQNNAKLQLLSDPSSKINLAHKIAETEAKVKQLKQQLLRIKKNKFLRERQIIKGNDKDKAQVQDLQVQYITLAKKEESFASKLQRMSQELADSQFNLLKQKDYYEQLKQQCSKIVEQSTPSINQEHLKLLYQSNKKKLELSLKRNERDDQTKKRKYYNLLLQYQNCKSRSVEIEGKILQKDEQNEEALMKINVYVQQLDRLKREKEEMYRNFYENKVDEQKNGFMITQAKEQRKKMSRLRSQTSNIENFASRQQMQKQKQFNNGSVHDSAIRRWSKRVEGSIARQVNETPKGTTKKVHTQENEVLNDKNYASVKNYTNQPQKSGRIRHFNNSKQRKQFSSIPAIIFGEQTYPSDFQGDENYS